MLQNLLGIKLISYNAIDFRISSFYTSVLVVLPMLAVSIIPVIMKFNFHFFRNGI